jgi:hypothetical protein
MGPFGGFLGGIAGGLVTGLISKAFKRKNAPSSADKDTVWVMNWPKALESPITLLPVNSLRGSGNVNITVKTANADARGIARQLRRELATA